MLCSPIIDPCATCVLAVMYFQKSGSTAEHAYGDSDAVWLEGYAAALGQAFALHFRRAAAASASSRSC